MRPLRRNLFSWLAVALCFLIGFLALAWFGMAWPPFHDDLPGWLTRWISYVGGALLGPVFLAGSIVALRNRKRAGTIFLIFMPVTVFCLAYPAAGYLVWHADGGGWFEVPEIPTAVGLTVVFFLPIFAGLRALRGRKRDVYLFAGTVALAGIVFGLSHWTKAFLPSFAGESAIFLLFGLFWRGTASRGWPSVLQPRSRSLGQRVTAFALACVVVSCVDVVVTFGLSALGSSLFSGDCRGKPLFLHPESPYHAVFTVRTIFVGRSLDDLINSRGVFRDPQFAELRDAPVGDWAVGVVQEEFWGLPFWTPRLVLLTNYIYWKNEDYFVDGSRGRGLLTRYLPIVGGGINCSRTKPAQDALVDLRALREVSFNSGTHLLGYVREPQTFARGLARPTPSKFAPGVRISVTGPSGTEIVTTDQTGIYRVDDLPPGDYTLQLLIPDDKTAGFWRNDGSPATISIAGHGLVERNFDLFWNGRIEGHVADDSGEPVQGWVKLLSPDGVQSPPYVKDALAAPDGSYQIKNIPPGRYKVMVDSSGVEYRFPPEIQYYPAKLPAEDAQVFELQQGQQIKGIDFKVRHLTQRTVRVRVTSPSGSALRDAFICVAYEHTQYFEPLEAKQCPKATEQDGVAVIHVYGKSRVRVFANQTIYNNQSKSFDEHHSHPVESEANAMPAKIDLVLDAPTP